MLSHDTLARLRELHPAVAVELEKTIQLAREATDPGLLELCSSYVMAALRQQNWSPPAGPLSDRESAFIEFTEQFAASVSTLSDEQVARLQAFASADEIYAFVNALYVADMLGRLELVTRRVL